MRSIADGECQFLFNVIDLYQTRVTTKMTLAMERLAVIAAVTLPITAIASVYGMNVIVNEPHPRHPAGAGTDRDGRHQRCPAALDPQTRLVVTS